MFGLIAIAVFLLAWSLRQQFVMTMRVDVPLAGDCKFYLAYAYNLVTHGTFSAAFPGAIAPVVPDDFRGPGYPLFLAAVLQSVGAAGDWYHPTLALQALLGALTVLLGMRLAREWLSRGMVLAAGLLMAVWPHHIAASGAILSEVFYGFVLMTGLLAYAFAIRLARPAWATAAGVAFALGYLVNPVILPFPLVLAWLSRRLGWRIAVPLVAIPLLVAGAWFARSQSLPESPVGGRAGLNLVQGSQPLFLDAWRVHRVDPGAHLLVASVDAEGAAFSRDPLAGLRRIGNRIASDPVLYGGWYLFRKPYLLWDWDIRIGAGGIYVVGVDESSLDRIPALAAVQRICRWLNGPLFVLASVTAFFLLFGGLREARPGPQVALAALCIYVTVVHAVLQAEPRYSIPYRPFEIALFFTGLAWCFGHLGSWRSSPRQRDLTGTDAG
jgi:hypothetical protein